MATGLALVAVVSLCGCRSSHSPWNVVLVTFDTVRADHLGCYGYPKRTSPRLDAFARHATLYMRAEATAPWTVPSHASLFTGKLPFEHGAHSIEVHKRVNNVRPLPLREVTLAEMFRAVGYRTGGFVANNGYLTRTFQFDQGFEVYDVQRLPATAVNRKVFAWLDQIGDAPFFLFVNYMDAHSPYSIAPVVGSGLKVPHDDPRVLLRLLHNRVMVGGEPAPIALEQKVRAQYDAGIANADLGFGELMHGLHNRRLFDRTLIVATSDHGEYLGEHSLVEHSKDVYEEALWVPLVVKDPQQDVGSVVKERVSTLMVPHRIIQAAPAELARKYARLLPDGDGDSPVVAENYYTRTHDLLDPRWGDRLRRVRAALYLDGFKFIRSSDGENELYRLDRDPGEQQNLIWKEPEVAQRLAARLADIFDSGSAAQVEGPGVVLEDSEIEKLRALGYEP